MKICELVKSRRRAGRVICDVYNGADILSRYESLKRVGLHDLPDESWFSADREQAVSVLCNCLTWDLAYQCELMPTGEARELARVFINSFSTDTTFLTNSTGYLSGERSHDPITWNPISDATFDTGIIALANGVVGIMWFEDED
jgi:hypothetical protein